MFSCLHTFGHVKYMEAPWLVKVEIKVLDVHTLIKLHTEQKTNTKVAVSKHAYIHA